MRRLAVILMLVLCALPAQAQGALGFTVDGEGPVEVRGEVSGVARFYGVSVVGAPDAPDPECRTTHTGFVCAITAPAFVSVPYLPTDARCGVRPALRWRAGAAAGVVYGPEPAVGCTYLPGVAR